MRRERFAFTGSQGQPLAAVLELPDEGEPKAYALFAHCFTCGKDGHAAVRTAAALAARGIATVRFDFTGLGASGGDFADTHFTSNIADLVAAADHMRQERRAPALMIGHSLGGAATLAAARDVPEARAVAVIGAPFEVAHVAHQFGEHVSAIEQAGQALVSLAGRPFTIRREFLEDLHRHDQGACIAALRRALLVLHAPNDRVVNVDNARRIFEAARHPKSFVALDGADHLLSRPDDAAYAAEVIAGWSSHYLASHRREGAAMGTRA
jgi:pimeloyl-ACP methyl ester carboxylesterase